MERDTTYRSDRSMLPARQMIPVDQSVQMGALTVRQLFTLEQLVVTVRQKMVVRHCG